VQWLNIKSGWLLPGKEDAERFYFTDSALPCMKNKKWADIVEACQFKAIKLADSLTRTPMRWKVNFFYNRKMYKETIQVAEDLVYFFQRHKANWPTGNSSTCLLRINKRLCPNFAMALNQGYLTKASWIKALNAFNILNK